MSSKFLSLLFTIVVLHKCSSYNYCDYNINVCFFINAFTTNLNIARDMCTGNKSVVLEIYNELYQNAVVQAFKTWGFNNRSLFCFLDLEYVNGVHRWQSNDAIAKYTKWNSTTPSYRESRYFISTMNPFNWYTDMDMTTSNDFYPVVCMIDLAIPALGIPVTFTFKPFTGSFFPIFTVSNTTENIEDGHLIKIIGIIVGSSVVVIAVVIGLVIGFKKSCFENGNANENRGQGVGYDNGYSGPGVVYDNDYSGHGVRYAKGNSKLGAGHANGNSRFGVQYPNRNNGHIIP